MAPQPADEVVVVRALLRARFAPDSAEVQPLAVGGFARAFAFAAGGRAYVARLNTAPHAAESFAKDDFAWRHFVGPALPIPRIVARGLHDGVGFAVSERAAGQRLDRLPHDERLALLPAVLDTLDAIARTDVRATTQGYGIWDGAGVGKQASWRDALAAIIENETEGFGRDWHALFRTSFLERDVFEAVYLHMLRLAVACPEERALVHGDYHFENLLAEGGRVTAVLDWANARYGDPLYDVAWFRWWADGDWAAWRSPPAVVALVDARYGATPRYAERLACYECHIGLDDMRYAATVGNRPLYDWARARLLTRVAGEAGAGTAI